MALTARQLQDAIYGHQRNNLVVGDGAGSSCYSPTVEPNRQTVDQSMPTIDYTISIGSILTIVTTICSVTIGAGTIVWKLAKWEPKLKMMWKRFCSDNNLDDGE